MVEQDYLSMLFIIIVVVVIILLQLTEQRHTLTRQYS